MEKDFVRRTGDVRVKLAPEMRARLDGIAQSYGFPLATMAAVAIAEWVNTKEQSGKNQRMMLMDLARQMGGQMGELLQAVADSPEVADVSDALVKRLQNGGAVDG